MNFGSLKQFPEFKTIEKRFKIAAQCQAEIRPHGYSARPGGPVQPRMRPTRYAWSPSTACAWDGAVRLSPVARRRLAGGKVLG
jgi:hypothetical protein